MSDIIFVKIRDKKLTFIEFDALAKKVVAHALSSGYAVCFHDEYIAKILKKEGAENTFTISDSFLYSHGDELLDVTEFAYDDEDVYEQNFLQKYAFFPSLLEIIFSFQISAIDFYILTNNEEDVASCVSVETRREDFLATLFQTFIARAPQTGIFPSMKIHVKW